MKICIECGEQFTPIGRQKVCKVCKDGVQETMPVEDKGQETQRPIERFRNKVVGPNGVMFTR